MTRKAGQAQRVTSTPRSLDLPWQMVWGHRKFRSGGLGHWLDCAFESSQGCAQGWWAGARQEASGDQGREGRHGGGMIQDLGTGKGVVVQQGPCHENEPIRDQGQELSM